MKFLFLLLLESSIYSKIQGVLDEEKKLENDKPPNEGSQCVQEEASYAYGMPSPTEDQTATISLKTPRLVFRL